MTQLAYSRLCLAVILMVTATVLGKPGLFYGVLIVLRNSKVISESGQSMV
jgi:hypothetical protein